MITPDEFNFMDSRVRRHAFIERENKGGGQIKSNLGPSNLPGNYGLIILGEDGIVRISPKAYPDDIVAWLYYMTKTNERVGPGIKRCLSDYVELMDQRAMKLHGFSHSEQAKALEWEYDDSMASIEDYRTEELEAEIKRRTDAAVEKVAVAFQPPSFELTPNYNIDKIMNWESYPKEEVNLGCTFKGCMEPATNGCRCKLHE